MKKTFLLSAICYLLFAFFTVPVLAATISPTASPTESVNNNAINDLKERIASRVAQLKLVERKGVVGTVTDVSDTQITLSDSQSNMRFVDVDELTKFSSPSAKDAFGISDITKGSNLGVLGLFNKQSRRVLARFVDVVSFPASFSGATASVDNKNFTLNVILENGEEKTVDVETVTKTLSYTKASGLTRLGFSKITEGEHVIVIGFQDVKNKNRIIASRIILFPEIPVNPKIRIPEKALIPQETTVPSTGSGKKLTPITR